MLKIVEMLLFVIKKLCRDNSIKPSKLNFDMIHSYTRPETEKVSSDSSLYDILQIKLSSVASDALFSETIISRA